MKEHQPKQVYWDVVNDLGELDVVASRKDAELTARRWTAPAYMAEPYIHVVRLVPEVVKTVRRKP
jgi:hypothetical protein